VYRKSCVLAPQPRHLAPTKEKNMPEIYFTKCCRSAGPKHPSGVLGSAASVDEDDAVLQVFAGHAGLKAPSTVLVLAA